MRWLEVTVGARPGQADLVGDVLLQHWRQGFSETTVRSRRLLRVYLPVTRSARDSVAALRRAVRKASKATRVATRVVDDTEWLQAWKASARPVRVGRLVVAPTWVPSRASAGRLLIRLNPGMAFGSGQHATTQLCLRAVERLVRQGATVIDVGTGSGVLAIAAARLGARRVVAVDNDPVAIAVARENVRANGVASRVCVRPGDGLRGARLRADLILANLTADTLPPILSRAGRCLRAGGRIVVSGFGAVRAEGVVRTAGVGGLRILNTTSLRGWYAIEAARR